MDSPEEKPDTKYTLRAKGILNGLDWSDWFGDMSIEQDIERGETVIEGMITDSADLYGLTSRLRNLGLTLISIEPTRTERP